MDHAVPPERERLTVAESGELEGFNEFRDGSPHLSAERTPTPAHTVLATCTVMLQQPTEALVRAWMAPGFLSAAVSVAKVVDTGFPTPTRRAGLLLDLSMATSAIRPR